MSWWSKKQSESSRRYGVKKGAKLGPRRRIIEVLRIPAGSMSPAHVRFECGHDGFTWSGCSAPAIGSYGHCLKCNERVEEVLDGTERQSS